MTSMVGTTTEYSTSKVDATLRLSTLIRSQSQTSTMQSNVTLSLRTYHLDKDGKIDFADKSVTENTRVSYPINHIKNIVRPISRLLQLLRMLSSYQQTHLEYFLQYQSLHQDQTQYYFLSGFTAKLAGTERGITEPTPTFSACFGQAFLRASSNKIC